MSIEERLENLLRLQKRSEESLLAQMDLYDTITQEITAIRDAFITIRTSLVASAPVLVAEPVHAPATNGAYHPVVNEPPAPQPPAKQPPDDDWTPREKKIAKPIRNRQVRPPTINGPRFIAAELLEEIRGILREHGAPLTCREIYLQAPSLQRRYTDDYHGIAGVGSILKYHGSKINAVRAKNPHNDKAYAWTLSA